jgi:hypothetical protein
MQHKPSTASLSTPSVDDNSPDVDALHDERKKNNREEYLASFVGQKEKRWVVGKELLPKWKHKIKEYKRAKQQGTSHHQQLQPPLQ